MLGHLGTWVSKLFNEGSKRLKTARGHTRRNGALHRRPVRDNPYARKKGEGWDTGGEIESGKKRKLRRSGHRVARASNPSPGHETSPRHPRGTLSPAAQPRHMRRSCPLSCPSRGRSRSATAFATTPGRRGRGRRRRLRLRQQRLRQ